MNPSSLLRSARSLTWAASLVLLATFSVAFGQPKLPDGAKALIDLPYVTDGHPQQKLDLYLPAEPKGPLVVWIHGGGWKAGSKSEVQPAALLQIGVTVASLEYRFTQHAKFPAQIEDCKSAIRWLKANAPKYGYNPNQVAAMGGSAGGHLTALLATTATTREFDKGEHLDQSSAIRCGIDFFGPTDFENWVAPSKIPLVQRTGSESALVQLLGGTVEEKLDLARKASPITWVSKESAPLFILHGTADQLVGPEQSERLAEKYKAAGVEVMLDIIQGANHGGPEFFRDGRAERMVEFLKRHLLP